MFLEGRIIELAIEVRVRNDIMDQHPRILEPSIIFSGHPGWDVIFGFVAIVS
jgi:hypothetical protein